MSWNKEQARTFVRDVRSDVGPVWGWIVLPLRKALIAEKALAVVRLQAAETVRVEDVDQLYFAMLKEAGLE